jgi:squalene monooxygenase
MEKALKSQRLRSMPNLYFSGHEDQGAIAGLLLLGDAYNIRHPLTGGGMTVGLNDVRVVRGLLNDIPQHAPDAGPVDVWNRRATLRTLERRHRLRRPLAATVNILANALYGVARDAELRRACFEYFRLGGRFVEGPVGFLSVLRPQPYLLVMHFFAVALFGLSRLALPLPTPSGVVRGARMVGRSVQLAKPLVDNENVTLLASLPLGSDLIGKFVPKPPRDNDK